MIGNGETYVLRQGQAGFGKRCQDDNRVSPSSVHSNDIQQLESVIVRQGHAPHGRIEDGEMLFLSEAGAILAGVHHVKERRVGADAVHRVVVRVQPLCR